MFEVYEYGKVEGSSLVKFLWVEVRTKVEHCGGILDGRDVGKLEGSGER